MRRRANSVGHGFTHLQVGHPYLRVSHPFDPGCEACSPSPGSFQHFAAHELRTDAPAPHPNPAGGHVWYHGTSFDPDNREEWDPRDEDDTDPGGRLEPQHHEPDEYGGATKHWNTGMGTHFTSLHHVAKGFATNPVHGFGVVRRPEPMSRIAHASLHMANPKVYASEHDMTREAIHHALGQGLRHAGDPDDDDWDPRHVNAEAARIDDNGPSSEPDENEQWLHHHPDREHVVDSFVDHLQKQGHDGIVYGNEHEGPTGHASAIAFHDTPVTMHHWEWLHPSKQAALEGQEGDDAYRMQHRPPDSNGTPMHDMTHNFPADIYTHPHYYSDMSDPTAQVAHRQINRVRGNPDAKVHIYRSLPGEHAHQGFRPGDWVSTSKDYARQHGRHAVDPKHDWPVIHTVVRAGDLHTDGDDFREFGYNGAETKPGNVAFKGGHHEEISDRADGGVRQVQRKQGPLTGKGYSFTNEYDHIGQTGGTVRAWHHDDYAGHMHYNADGSPEEPHIEPEHQHVADELVRRMKMKLPPRTSLGMTPNQAHNEPHERTAGRGKPRHDAPDVDRRAGSPRPDADEPVADEAEGNVGSGVASGAPSRTYRLCEHPAVA